ncbi:ABC transporter permease [Planctomicrobium sp. SH661]|uniref:ABC transporter permease n=1 Tax=Planctomicrobium sp. SH661 TaxID=3448124 RepID=UPI003F5C7125
MNHQKIKNLLVNSGGLCLVLGVMILVFSLQSENFFQRSTFTSIANQIPDLTLMAVGMTFVLITGGIDLSAGSILALSSAVLGTLMVDSGWSLSAAAPVAVLSGALCGLINGLISVGFRIPSFIVTLGMLEIARGATKAITNSQTKYIGSKVEWIGEPLASLHLSPAFLIAASAVLLGQLIISYSVFGRYCIAIGTNAEAVRMSGIRTARYSIAVFMLSGCLCGLAGIAQASRLSSADPNAAIGLELAAIASCVIGGTSLMGGRGSVLSTFIGVLMISVLQSGLAQLGISDANKQMITGVVIVVAVLVDALRHRFRL